MIELLEELENLDIRIKLEGDNLKISGLNKKLPANIIEKLKREKTNLIEYLKNASEIKKRKLSPSDFTYKKLSIEEANKFTAKYEIEDIYQLTPMQEGMLFHAIHDPFSSAYFMQMSYRLQSKLSTDLIRNSLNELFKRHEILRTVFIYKDVEIPLQVVLKNRECGFTYEDIRRLGTEEKELYVADFKKRDISNGFLLDQDVLMRVSLLQLGDTDYELIWSHHHILMDGWCIGIINNELFKIYNSLLNNIEISLPIVTPYKEYIKWLNSADKNDSLKYWKKYLSGYEEPSSLPTLTRKESEFVQKSESISFSEEISSKVKIIAAENIVTPNVFLQSVWSIVLGKCSCKEDVVFGSVVSGRPSEIHGIETIVGLFINNVPVRAQYRGDETIIDLLKRVQSSNLNSEPHHNISLAEIQSQSLLKQNLIDHIIVFDNYPVSENIKSLSEGNEYEKLKLEITDLDIFEQTNYNLTIIASLTNRLSVKFVYNSNVYDPEMMSRLMVYLENVVIGVIDNLAVKISNIDILTEEEKQQLLYEFNDTNRDYPKDKTIHQLFEEQVELTPDRIALIMGDRRICYNDLNKMSNQVALNLLEFGVGSESIVALLVDRSVEMMIGILGILKTGGAYLPIDPEAPEKRVNYILADSNAKVLLLRKNKNEGKNYILPVMVINSDLPIKEEDLILDNTNPHNLSYVIYTSGSTGEPKGVMIEHHSVINRLKWMQNSYPIGSKDVLIQKTPYTFDVSVWELFWWFLEGSTLFLLEKGGEKDPSQIVKGISENDVSIIHFVPSMLDVFLEYLKDYYQHSSLDSLRYIFASGEELKNSHVEKFYEVFGKESKCLLVNLYGPTEATVDVTYFNCNCKDQYNSIPIGKPIANTQVYILNTTNYQLQAVGLVGELCLSGVGLSRGYLGMEELTSEKFIDHPFKEGDRLYRTGDLAKWLPDGNIEFVGRIDDQVKIRGFRIELGEIESVLLKHENINESVVIVRDENGDNYLCAYIVCKEELDHEELRSYLLEFLPNYMLPSYFVELEKIPLTNNGKVDKKSLPEPEMKAGDDYVAPRNDVEKLLVEVWSKVLGVENIGITDNFFSLGGDSIKTIQIHSRMNKAGFWISIRDIFVNPTISELSQKVSLKKAEINQDAVRGNLRMTPIQHEFFIDDEDIHHYNQSVMLYSKNHLDEEKIKAIFRKLQDHHDALRIICKNTNGDYSLFNEGLENFQISLKSYDLENENDPSEKIMDYSNQIQRSIDLEIGPLMKLGLFHLTDGDRLLIVIHHLVVDGISWRIIFEDIETLYGQATRGEKLTLQLKSNSFKDWSDKLTAYSKSNKFLEEKSFWGNIANQEVLTLNRNIDDERYENAEIGSMQFNLDETITSQLLTKTNEAYGTGINDILLCGLGYCVKNILGNERVLISLEGHGREDIFSDIDISRTIGWFTTVYPVLLDMEFSDNMSMQIKSVKESIHQIPEKGIGYGILKYLTPATLKDDLQFNNKAQIEFNYLGQFDSDVDQMSHFSIANEFKGEEASTNRELNYDFSINGMISKGKLAITVSYRKKYYSEKLISALLESYKKSLISIINHCKNISDKLLTPSDFTYKKLSIIEVDKLSLEYDIEDIYELTPMQKGMLFHAIHDPDSSAYFQQMSYRLQSDLSVKLMFSSFNELFKRHEILRTVFIYENLEIPLQVVLKNRECGFIYEDIRRLSTEEKELYVADFKKRDVGNGFLLDQDVLMRVSLLQLGDNDYELIWSHHHILMDGWCINIINNDFFEIYNSSLNNRNVSLPQVTHYKEYIKWLNRINKNTSLEYWKEYLSGYEEQAILPCLIKQENGFVQQSESIQFSIEVSAKFQKIVSKNNVTANVILQCVWAIVLGKYSNKEDVVFGSVVSGRPSEIAGIETIVGLFINNIPIRIKYSQDTKFSTLIKKVQNLNIDSESHHYVSLVEIQSQSLLKQNLIDHILVFENYPVEENIKHLNEGYEYEELNLEITDVDLFQQVNYNLWISASLKNRLSVRFNYNSNVYDSGMMARLKVHFENVIIGIVNDPGMKISAIDILKEEEKQQLLYEFNNTKADYPKDKTIHQLFEEQVKRSPDSSAIVFKDNVITYKELNADVNRITNYLLSSRNLKTEEGIGILLDRTPNLIISILGILKAGCAYVPLDTSLPEDRVRAIVNDAKIGLILSEKKFVRRLNRLQWECNTLHTFLCMDSNNVIQEEEHEKNNLMSEELWGYIGETAVDEITGGGWQSSYTGEPLSYKEMDEYGNNIVKKLQPLLHKDMRILEIGCASGITMYRIAPSVKHYHGTDLSKTIIENNNKKIAEKGYKNIFLSHLAAHEIDQIQGGRYDLIIINSVVQYFHGHNYLRKVINKAINLLSNKGCLFVGDVMDLDLKENLIESTKSFKKTYKNKRTKTEWSEELFISRTFFEDLSIDIPEIEKIEFSEKIYTIENELTRFRYDALINIDKTKKRSILKNRRHKYQEDLRTLQESYDRKINTTVKTTNLAYIIYTSGSTGTPKGVMIEHGNIVNFIYGMTNLISFKEKDILLSLTTVSFDIFGLEIFVPLTIGSSLVLGSNEDKLSPQNISSIILNKNVSILQLTPSTLKLIISDKESAKSLDLLNNLLVGGEELPLSLLTELREQYQSKIYNMYGPTETTIWSTAKDVSGTKVLNIGKPILNTQIYILGAGNKLQAIGVSGELCIAGDGLARGYNNNEELTKEKFIDHPYKEGEKLYRTGDLARWLPDGNIEFLGRIDHQVKIRGFRIELGEIENALLKHESIKESVVLAREDKDDKYLCAYIVCEGDLSHEELRTFLFTGLPDYMIPSYFVELDSLPLTTSGKVNRKALPSPEVNAGESYVAPSNETEEQLVKIWSEVLNIPKEEISVIANFFTIGGHSLKATILVSKIFKEFNVKIQLNEVFKFTTVSKLSDCIKTAVKDNYYSIDPAEEKDYYELSSAQKRLYFLQEMDLKSSSYNMPLVLNLNKSIEKDKLESTLKKLIKRHEALRTSFERLDGIPVQKIHHNVDFKLDYYEVSEVEANIIVKNYIRSFDLSKAPLIRSALIKLPSKKHIWIVDIHHIISDGTSDSILIEDFTSLYSDIKLPKLKLQYKDFSNWQNFLLESGKLEKQKKYWLDLYSEEIPKLNLITDFKRPELFTNEGDIYTFLLNRKDYDKLKKLSAKFDGTLYMNILALLNVLFHKYTGQTDIIIGSGIAGRGHIDLQKTIGMFVNSLAMRNFPLGTKTYEEFLQEVINKSVLAFENQDVQFEDLIEKLGVERDPSRNPLFDICMVVQNYRKTGEGKNEEKSPNVNVLSAEESLVRSFGNKTAKFDMTFFVNEIEDDLFITIEYYTRILKKETIITLSNHLKDLVKQIVDNSEIIIDDIILSRELEDSVFKENNIGFNL
ncbi:MAG: amino acid adenylation domain-containing protein [Bacteroidales bacterium]|nr:amino acid adenylation domain-containing protein [Bacteroidales bacterium]